MSSSQTSSSSSEPVVEAPALAATVEAGAGSVAGVQTPHPFADMLDVRCLMEVFVGETMITVRDCLKLHRHSVIRLPSPAGADLDVRIGGIPIGTGEVVIVDDTTALRIVQVGQPAGTEVQE